MSLAKKLNLDVDFETARALHRVVRGMHDGECPKCHTIHASDKMVALFDDKLKGFRKGDLRCPYCSFFITQQQISFAIQAFAPVMEKNLEIFETWRQSLENAPADVHFSSAPSNKGTVSK